VGPAGVTISALAVPKLKKYSRRVNDFGNPVVADLSEVDMTFAVVLSVFLSFDALDECQASDGCRARFLSELFNLMDNAFELLSHWNMNFWTRL
jgi:hypothetical protein